MYFRQKNLPLLVLVKLLHQRKKAANQLRNVEEDAVKQNRKLKDGSAHFILKKFETKLIHFFTARIARSCIIME